MQKAIFFDRDGILNSLVFRDGGQFSPQVASDFKILNEAKNFTKKTSSLGYLNIIVSNQPDIARKKMSCEDLHLMTQKLYEHLCIDDCYYCIHDDSDKCSCRKPKPGLIFKAKKKWKIDLKKSYLIGDTYRDIEAAKSAGVKPFLMDREYNRSVEFSHRVKTLGELLKFI